MDTLLTLLTHPLVLVLLGVAVVVGGILALRLHAFLALTLAALLIGSLTPRETREEYLVGRRAVEFAPNVGTPQYEVHLLAPPGTVVLVFGRGDDGTRQHFRTVVTGPSGLPGWSVIDIPPDQTPVGAPFLAVAEQDWLAARKEAGTSVGKRIGSAFGATCGNIGIVIAMAAIIGKCLLDSGAADRIVRAALGVVGERGAPLAFLLSGFLLGIPVFFDTVFYLMIPLGKALHVRTGRGYLLYILTIVAGATMAHSLVPPTPGPLLVAAELGVDLGTMIAGGLVVGLAAASAGFAYATWISRRAEVPLRESPELSSAALLELAKRPLSELPPLWLSLAPIVLPVALIAGGTTLDKLGLTLSPAAQTWLATLSDNNVALTLAAAVAIVTLVWRRRPSRAELAEGLSGALSSGGTIILITAAGGAFGAMLQLSGIVALIHAAPSGSPLMVLTLAFLVTAAVRTAQGSATVAMITAAGVLGGLADPMTLGCHPVYLALAIGCGSKPVAWMNDSGFWVICKMSGMTEAEGLRFIAPLSILMGLAGLATTLVVATIWP